MTKKVGCFHLSERLLETILAKHNQGSLSNDEMRSHVLIGQLSSSVASNANIAELEVWTSVNVLVKVMTRPNHELSPATLSQLPDHIHKCKAVFGSDTTPGSVVVLTLEQHQGDPVLVTLKLNTQKPTGKGNAHWMTSAYPKQNHAVKFVEWEGKGLLIWGKY